MIYDMDEIKRRVTPVLKKYEVNAAFIFGSYARGEATDTSDIDIRIDTTGSSKLLGIFAESGLLIELESALDKKVDMITMIPKKSLNFKKNLLREEKNIYDAIQ